MNANASEAMRLLTVSEVAEQLCVSSGLVYKLARTGQIEHHRIGARLRFSQQQVDDYLQRSVTEVVPNEPLRRLRHL